MQAGASTTSAGGSIALLGGSSAVAASGLDVPKGHHEVTSSWTSPRGSVFQTTLGITRSNITFIGQGTGETTVLGGFGIRNVQNITLKQLTVKKIASHLGAMSLSWSQSTNLFSSHPSVRKIVWSSS